MGGPGSGRKRGSKNSNTKTSKIIQTTAGKQKIKGRTLNDGSFQVSRFPNAKKKG